jgi:hypothetical protein
MWTWWTRRKAGTQASGPLKILSERAYNLFRPREDLGDPAVGGRQVALGAGTHYVTAGAAVYPVDPVVTPRVYEAVSTVAADDVTDAIKRVIVASEAASLPDSLVPLVMSGPSLF